MGGNILIWNLHRWFLDQGIVHECQIGDELAFIRGIRWEESEDDTQYAIVSELYHTARQDECISMIRQGKNKILFKGQNARCILNLANQMMSSYVEWGKMLQRINMRQGTIRELLEESEKVISFPIMLVKENALVAFSPGYEKTVKMCWQYFAQCTYEEIAEEDCVCDSRAELFNKSSAVITEKKYFGGVRTIIGNIWMDGRRFLKLVALEPETAFSMGDILLMNELLKALQINVVQNRLKYGQDLTEQIFQNAATNYEMDTDRIDLALKRKKWRHGDRYVAYYLEAPAYLSGFGFDKMEQDIREKFHGICVCSGETGILVISNLKDKDLYQEKEKMRRMTRERSFTFGKSCISRDFYSLHHIARQAREVAEKAFLNQQDFLDAEELRERYLYKEMRESSWCQSLVLPQVRMLVTEDEKKHTKWCRTLYVFLKNGCNTVAAARELGIHRSSLNNRLEQMKKIIGDEWLTVSGKEQFILSLLISGIGELSKDAE